MIAQSFTPYSKAVDGSRSSDYVLRCKSFLTIFCVYQSSQGIGTGGSFWDGAGLVRGELPGGVNDFGLSLNADGKLLAGTGNPGTTIAPSSSGFNDGMPHIMAFKRTRSNGELELFVDGTPEGTTIGSDTHAVPGQANYYKVAAFNSCGIGIESTVAEALVPMPDLRIRAEGGS
jgi:hypothetical protein